MDTLGKMRWSTALLASAMCVGVLGGCAFNVGNSGSEPLAEEPVSESGDPDRVATPKQEFSLNRMNQAYGVGAPGPSAEDWPHLTENWYLEIPATNEECPRAYPLVDYQDRDFYEMRDAEQSKLEEALSDVQKQTGVGPWVVDAENATGCGPHDKRTTSGRNIGAAVTYGYVANIEATDKQFSEAVRVLEGYYPGITAEGNIMREYDDTERRTWNMASDRDDFLAVSRIVGHNRVVLTFQSACFVTLDNIKPPASRG